MLKMNAVSTSYGPVPMLRQVSLHVGEGEMVCLLGPNGAGKSTTFNALCGLLPLDGGTVEIAGRNLQEVGPERLASLGVGFVPEGRRLFPTLTVRDNLRLAFDAARNPDLSFSDQLQKMAKLFPRIEERLGQGAGTMSGGEQAMVALARALIGNPRLVVMDEPSLGLSPKLISEYFEIVARIRDEGKAVLLIEQNAETALSIAERGYLLVRGQVAISGTSAEMVKNDTIRHLYL
ncbi:ABC transporter ATP-binding protein [Pseudogemmobacter faecipullorum]|uniref:ABC transporter ATP-binding protein n=1 Tax=Pseudogemmobacter faecipullorum TaxID=2755041 RepID=A0ABS8CNG7_9RHOB|nr:ABC transporter ATP-binding protein [Pseudogemmobacter faecipullorum]MCB5410950.1 ABC transporter ATP-binding protein [Pseudogemmobacter faecipullorum]